MKRTITTTMLALGLAAAALVATPGTAAADWKVQGDPIVIGEPRVGKTLTATAGTYRFRFNAGTDALNQRFVWTYYEYQWLRSGEEIPQADDKTYQPGPDDVGHRLSVEVTTIRGRSAPIVAESKPTNPVLPGIVTAGFPTIGGKNKVGQFLEVKPGSWKPKTASPEWDFTYQWYVNGVPVESSNPPEPGGVILPQNPLDPPTYIDPVPGGDQYLPSSDDVGKKITVKVTYGPPGYLPKSRTATKAGVVQP